MQYRFEKSGKSSQKQTNRFRNIEKSYQKYKIVLDNGNGDVV